jgi:hypothetical protein
MTLGVRAMPSNGGHSGDGAWTVLGVGKSRGVELFRPTRLQCLPGREGIPNPALPGVARPARQARSGQHGGDIRACCARYAGYEGWEHHATA